MKDKAPAAYLAASDVFPSGANPELLEPHFIDEKDTQLMRKAAEDLADEQAADLNERFRMPARRPSSTRSVVRAESRRRGRPSKTSSNRRKTWRLR